jgi:hypothetical protein
MAVVQGIKEKVHLPLYDSISVDPEKQLRDVETSGTLKFFVNVQGKNKLETNLQSASLLPHYNTFEARAMRVVISDLPPEFPQELTMLLETDFGVTDDEDNSVFIDAGYKIGVVEVTATVSATGTTTKTFTVIDEEPGFSFNPTTSKEIVADLRLGLDLLVELLKEARESEDGFASLSPDEDGVKLRRFGETTFLDENVVARIADFGSIFLSAGEIESFIESLPEKNQPPKEQLNQNNGSGTLIGKFVYNTVTSFFVGEKVMMAMPTFFFPAGAGPYSQTGNFATHGEPSPTATFRFAEPIYIDKQQNFRVEIEIPDADTLKDLQRIYGPFNLWVVLDGYMTRDVQ